VHQARRPGDRDLLAPDKQRVGPTVLVVQELEQGLQPGADPLQPGTLPGCGVAYRLRQPLELVAERPRTAIPGAFAGAIAITARYPIPGGPCLVKTGVTQPL